MDGSRFEYFSNLIGTVSKSLQKIESRGMERYGLRSAHILCMRQLDQAPEGLNREELVHLCNVDKAQISRLIGDLRKKNYIAEREGGKRYRKKFVLTEEGLRITAEINAIIARVFTYVSGEIPEELIGKFYDTLRQICRNLKLAEGLPLHPAESGNS